MTIKEEEALNQWLNEQLKVGLIVESKSQYAVPCFYIPKKDGSLRLVQDYRKLNQVTIKDKTPLPLIGEVINKLKEAKYFNKLDLIWGYNNIRVKIADDGLYFIFSLFILFYFSFSFSFFLSIFRTTWVRGY